MIASPQKQPSDFRDRLRRTPGRLWTLFGVVALSTVVLWLVYLGGLGYARASVQTITKDSIPSVVAAQQIRQGFYQMDGDTVANYLQLTHGGKAIYDINGDRLQIAKQLVVAAQNITYGDAEGDPIKTMVGRLPMYAELTSPALEGQGNWRARRLLMASTLLHKELVESANQLDKVNRDHLTAAYTESMTGLRTRASLNWGIGLLFLVVLGFVQLTIARKSHRWVNLPLAIVTLLALVTVFLNGRVLGFEAKQLKVAKSDAFDSVGFLSEAQADAADARALAMYGLIPEGKDPSWPECHKELGNLAATSSDEELARTYQQGSDPTFKGLLGNELRNITFDGEREAANGELHAFATFDHAVLGVEAKESALGISDGIQLAFSPEGSIDSTAAGLNKAIEATTEINQKQFEDARDRAVAGLTFPTISLNVLALAMILLAYFGVRQRAAEYED